MQYLVIVRAKQNISTNYYYNIDYRTYQNWKTETSAASHHHLMDIYFWKHFLEHCLYKFQFHVLAWQVVHHQKWRSQESTLLHIWAFEVGYNITCKAVFINLLIKISFFYQYKKAKKCLCLHESVRQNKRKTKQKSNLYFLTFLQTCKTFCAT